MNVTQAQLKGAVGFDKDHWQGMADDSFGRDLQKRCGIGVDVDSNGVNVDIIRKSKRVSQGRPLDNRAGTRYRLASTVDV